MTRKRAEVLQILLHILAARLVTLCVICGAAWCSYEWDLKQILEIALKT